MKMFSSAFSRSTRDVISAVLDVHFLPSHTIFQNRDMSMVLKKNYPPISIPFPLGINNKWPKSSQAKFRGRQI